MSVQIYLSIYRADQAEKQLRVRVICKKWELGNVRVMLSSFQ